MNIIQFCSIFVSFDISQSSEYQKVFLIVTFVNGISRNKGLKAKISWFFLCFFCLTPPRQECSRIRKTSSFLTLNRLKKIQRSTSTELHKWSEKVVNVENFSFLKVNCRFLVVMSKMKTVSMFYNSSLL